MYNVGRLLFDSFVPRCVVFRVDLGWLDPDAGNPDCFCVRVPTDENGRFGSVGQDQASIHVGCKVLPLFWRRLDNKQTFSFETRAKASYTTMPIGILSVLQAYKDTSIRVHPLACTSGCKNVRRRCWFRQSAYSERWPTTGLRTAPSSKFETILL